MAVHWSGSNGDGIGEPVESWYMPEEDMPSYAIAQSDDFEENIWDFNGSGRLIQTVLTIH